MTRLGVVVAIVAMAFVVGRWIERERAENSAADARRGHVEDAERIEGEIEALPDISDELKDRIGGE